MTQAAWPDLDSFSTCGFDCQGSKSLNVWSPLIHYMEGKLVLPVVAFFFFLLARMALRLAFTIFCIFYA